MKISKKLVHNLLHSNVTIDSKGLHVKPIYPVSDALVGYGSTVVSIEHNNRSASDDVDEFSWGIGIEYGFTENSSVFIDYTRALAQEIQTLKMRLNKSV